MPGMALHLMRRKRTDDRPLALLDLGSSKVACLIVMGARQEDTEARIGAPLAIRRLGMGLTRSRGIRAGVVTDLAEAEDAVRQAVGQAEAEAGVTIDEVVVAVGGGRISSLNFAASRKITGASIVASDVSKVLAGGKTFAEQNGRAVLHMHRLGFRVDGEGGIRNPRGLPGRELSIDLNAVAVEASAVRNIEALLGRCYLTASHLVAAPYASALATLTGEELQEGALVIDMGAGTTTFALFGHGLFLHAGAIAVGSQQITLDIARAFSIPLNQAERIKALYGNLISAMSDEHEFVPLAGGTSQAVEEVRITRAQLRRAVAPRIDETLQRVRAQVAASGLAAKGPWRVVLTGGASQLAGIAEVAERHFDCAVRMGVPQLVSGLPDAKLEVQSSQVLGTCIGLAYAVLVAGALPQFHESKPDSPAGYAGRLGQWFKESFWDDERPAGAA